MRNRACETFLRLCHDVIGSTDVLHERKREAVANRCKREASVQAAAQSVSFAYSKQSKAFQVTRTQLADSRHNSAIQEASGATHYAFRAVEAVLPSRSFVY